MGTHTARRSRGGMSSVAGRGVLTAAAAFALIGGGTGMAFAGEATSDDAASTSADHHGDHHGDKGHEKGHEKGHHKGHDGSHSSCEIPILDGLSTAGNDVTAPVHDAVCPPLRDVLGGAHGTDDLKKPDVPQGAPKAMSPKVG